MMEGIDMRKKSRGSVTLEACLSLEAILLAMMITYLISANIYILFRNQIFLNQCASEIATLTKLEEVTPETIEKYYQVCSLECELGGETKVNKNIVSEIMNKTEIEAIKQLCDEPQNLTYCTALLANQKIEDATLKNIVLKARLFECYNVEITNIITFFIGVEPDNLDFSQSYLGEDKIILNCEHTMLLFDIMEDMLPKIEIQQRSVSNTW